MIRISMWKTMWWWWAEFFQLLGKLPKSVQFLRAEIREASNYRPISLLPILSEVCERVVLNQLALHLTSSHLENISETKLQQKMALYWNIANFYYWFSSHTINQKKINAIVYLDTSKAFDTTTSVILLKNWRTSVYHPLHFNGLKAIFLRDTRQSI